VTSAVHAENALKPCDDFVGGGVGGLVEVDDTGGDVGFEIAAQWCASGGNRCEVTGADENCAENCQWMRNSTALG
jgi:hypothetical protein